MDSFGFLFFSILTSSDPEIQQYYEIFNFFFSLLMSFSLAAMIMGWIFRIISRS